jgi:hypothetical protein
MYCMTVLNTWLLFTWCNICLLDQSWFTVSARFLSGMDVAQELRAPNLEHTAMNHLMGLTLLLCY